MNETTERLLNDLYVGMPQLPDDSEPVSRFFFGAGHIVKIYLIPKGRTVREHIHEYDHRSMVAVGHGVLITEKGSQQVKEGEDILIKAGKMHAYFAEADTIWLCIHKDTEPEAQKLYVG